MENKYKQHIIYAMYALIVAVIFGLMVWLGHIAIFQKFLNKIEHNSFDVRQAIVSLNKSNNKDITILAIDDATYEYIMDKFGSWPISRKVWSEVIDSVEKVEPKYIVFDLLFIKPNLADVYGDNALIKSIKNNENVFLSMNFDNYSDDIRKSAVLDDKLKLNVTEGSLEDNYYLTFVNSRPVMKQISDVTDNIGAINVTREQDGIIRNVTPVFRYKNEYFPNLSLAVALDLLGKDEVSIKNNSIIIDSNHVIPLDKTQRAILNWYGKSKTYKHVSLWEVLKAQKENNIKFLEDNFRNKIIYIGTTATSLADVKSVPIEYNMAGVEIHATFLNNILDSNFIKKVDSKIDLLISVILSLLIGYVVLKTPSVFKTILFLFAVLFVYGAFSVWLMSKFNLWIGIVIPYISMIAVFVLVYCEKYLLKVKDYEQTYRLAVTDGLTQLYNHRYFQEQMIVNLNNFKRYNIAFSLILIDIDFFKKFNDTYGHQSGDCVLKQVASILKRNSRTSDIVCRYGGEEMSIILTNTNKEEAKITANKICLAVRNNKFTLANNEKVNVTISVGVATAGINGEKVQEMIEYADKCLYKAKESGRNQVISEV